MSNTKNSLSTLMSQFIRLNRNALEIFQRLNEAITSSRESVTIDLFDDNDTLKSIQVPSFGHLLKRITDAENNIKNLTSLGDTSVNVRLSDGSYRKVIASKLKVPAANITSVASPTTFNIKSNYFFESFIDPLMYVTLDLSGQIPISTEDVLVRRYLLQIDNEDKRKYFNKNLKGRSNISFTELVNSLLSQSIEFLLDEEILQVPPRSVNFTGSFNVIKISDVEKEVLVNGVTSNVRRKSYKLNKLTYNDTNSGFSDTLSLKIGDQLMVNTGNKNTRFKVTEIDSSTNSVIVEIIEGYDSITIGSNVLSIYKGLEDNISIDIPVGFDEYLVVFIKSIDPESKLPSEKWSPGSSFLTNELSITLDSGQSLSLDTFYRNQAVDFGQLLLSFSKDKSVPSAFGVTPNTPTPSTSDFTVVQINNHLTDNPVIDDIKRLADDRNRLASEIKEKDAAIQSKRTVINTKQYSSDVERQKDLNELQALVDQRTSSANLFASTVQDIQAKSKSQDLINAQPKYRVRGFWQIPDPVFSKYTGNQEIVKFHVEYRYLTTSGSANKIDQLSFTDKNGAERRGAFTNWVIAPTVSRTKVMDEVTGVFTWQTESVEDADTININQLDIPIQQGESIEIRIKSVSEAGYPSNPLESEYSEVVRVDFPQELIQPDTTSSIISQNEKELARVQLDQDLKSKGIDEHLSSSFSANGKYFAHTTTAIASGFLSTEQTPIALFDKLVDMQNKINQLEQYIQKARGELAVTILDNNGVTTYVNRETLVTIFAGYYSQDVANLNIRKGAIVSKNYFVRLTNVKATALELLSRISGDRNKRAYQSGGKFNSTTIDPFVTNDTYYTSRGKYDYVPISYSQPVSPTTFPISSYALDVDIKNPNSYRQSTQARGQYLYCRYRNIGNTEDFYVDYNFNTKLVPTTPSLLDYEYTIKNGTYTTIGTVIDQFIWNGTYTNTNTPNTTAVTDGTVASDYSSGNTLLLHVDHPAVKNSNSNLTTLRSQVRMAKTSILVSSDGDGKKQTAFYYDTVENNSIKSSFESNDQYLLGKASCGCYMFLLPRDERNLKVGGDDALSSFVIEVGDNNSVSIPLVFQYRMTDYYGVGFKGIGAIAGDYTGVTNDLRYAKRMGIDLFDIDGNRFSFDLEIFAKYAVDKLNIDSIPSVSISTAIKDLTSNIPGTEPNINTTTLTPIAVRPNVPRSGSGGCFVKGTLVTMADRTRMKIENIIPGVEVVTYNQATESFEIGKVIDIQTPKNNNIINILTDDITINCTTSHPFWSVNKNDWASYDPALTEEHHAMKVLHLEEGDILLDENGEQVKINTINIDNKSRKITTYNLTVEGNSNYFANGILVHNKLASNFQNAI
jgi:hypothetical protein